MFAWNTNNAKVPTYDDLPTDPYVNCDWGDGSFTKDELFIMGPDNNMAINKNEERMYYLEHDYENQGEYLIECSMENKVSVQSLTHTVSFNALDHTYTYIVTNIRLKNKYISKIVP